MKHKNNKTNYGPNERNFLEAGNHPVKSYSKNHKSYTPLPDNVEDDIVVNNIAYSEFDYTYSDDSNTELNKENK
ncbi:hypothetical protein [Hathewaya limosa]|uniref:Uncharacterized protein n=1 Tax=Hathewaya limosa TaxID=1536 RepID=A0ABU0JSB7_HATLI|nr:hypothetical protein [Hathewaya limosa]AWZ47784.1 hypothetical protein C3495_02505 [Clostridiaceae bacterium 14S0207]MDQ0479968.1 hypothetical protein [Hathewaya limosa]